MSQILFIPLCFVAGMASEQIGILSIIALITLGGFCIFKRCGRLPWWFWVYLVVFIAGWIALYLSPGHAKRAVVVGGRYLTLGGILELGLIDKLKRIYVLLNEFQTRAFSVFCAAIFCLVSIKKFYAKLRTKFHISIVVFLYILGIVIVLVLAKHAAILCHIAIIIFFVRLIRESNNRNEKTTFIIMLGIYLAYILCALSLIQVMSIPHRAHLGDVMMIIAIVVLGYYQFLINNKIIKKLIFLISAIYAAFVLGAYVEYRINWNGMLKYIDEQKAAGNYDIVVKSDVFKHKYFKYKNFTNWGNPGENPNEWPNTTYAKKFGVNSFKVDFKK